MKNDSYQNKLKEGFESATNHTATSEDIDANELKVVNNLKTSKAKLNAVTLAGNGAMNTRLIA